MKIKQITLIINWYSEIYIRFKILCNELNFLKMCDLMTVASSNNLTEVKVIQELSQIPFPI